MDSYNNTQKCASCRTWNDKSDYFDQEKMKELRSCFMCRNRQKVKYSENKKRTLDNRMKYYKAQGGKLIPKCPYEGYSNISNQICYNNDLRKTKPIVYEDVQSESEGEEYLTKLDELQDIAIDLVELRKLQSLNKGYEDKKGDFYDNFNKLILTKGDKKSFLY
jgi:hypothetical protein